VGVARGRWLIASMAQQKAAAQLGTVGSGNYYVDLLRDDDGLVWIGVHFGSRELAPPGTRTG
jgi:RNA-splicing ligase RtcB